MQKHGIMQLAAPCSRLTFLTLVGKGARAGVEQLSLVYFFCPAFQIYVVDDDNETLVAFVWFLNYCLSFTMMSCMTICTLVTLFKGDAMLLEMSA